MIHTTVLPSVGIRGFAKVADAISAEKHILPQSPSALEEQYSKALSAIKVQGGVIVAHATLWYLIDNWYELGTVWVAPKFRGQDIATELYKSLFAANTTKDILVTTTNPAAVRVGEKSGAIELYRKQLSKEVWRASCVCPSAKTGGSADTCVLAYGEIKCSSPCKFAVSPSTASRLFF